MKNTMDKKNTSMIKNILTLRYDPTLKINRQKFSWKNFITRDHPNYLDFIENKIIESIKNEIDIYEK